MDRLVQQSEPGEKIEISTPFFDVIDPLEVHRVSRRNYVGQLKNVTISVMKYGDR